MVQVAGESALNLSASDSRSASVQTVRGRALAERIVAALAVGPSSGNALARALRVRPIDVRATCAALAAVGRVVREGQRWFGLPAPRCEGANVEGERCGRDAAIGSRYCSLHVAQDVPAPAPKQPTWFDVICRYRARVLDPIGFDNYPPVADLARELPRVLRRVNRREDYAAAVRWSIEHDQSFRLLFEAAIDLANKDAAANFSVDRAGKSIYADPGSFDEPEDLHDVSETLL